MRQHGPGLGPHSRRRSAPLRRARVQDSATRLGRQDTSEKCLRIQLVDSAVALGPWRGEEVVCSRRYLFTSAHISGRRGGGVRAEEGARRGGPRERERERWHSRAPESTREHPRAPESTRGASLADPRAPESDRDRPRCERAARQVDDSFYGVVFASKGAQQAHP